MHSAKFQSRCATGGTSGVQVEQRAADRARPGTGQRGNFRGGVHVRGHDLNGDGIDDFVAETRQGNKQMLRGFDASGKHLKDLSETIDDAPGL